VLRCLAVLLPDPGTHGVGARHAGLTIVLGHLGGLLNIGPYAGRKDEVFAQWKEDLTELAACPNVVVKLGGMANPRFGFGCRMKRGRRPSDEFAAATCRYSSPASNCSDRIAACREQLSDR